MKKSLIIILLIFISCRNKISLNPNITINNESDFNIDSLIIRDVVKNITSVYNIKPHTNISKRINLEGKFYPKNDGIAFEVFVFCDSLFFSTGKGIIDPPFSNVEEKYDFNLWNEGLGYYVDGKKYFEKPKTINQKNLKKSFFYGRSWREE
tara:strand:+ start:497 stop:949 length:453 start_codon:yes stop_codon:yes gene_type:complete